MALFEKPTQEMADVVKKLLAAQSLVGEQIGKLGPTMGGGGSEAQIIVDITKSQQKNYAKFLRTLQTYLQTAGFRLRPAMGRKSQVYNKTDDAHDADVSIVIDESDLVKHETLEILCSIERLS